MERYLTGKNPCHISQKVLFYNKWRKITIGEPTNPDSLEEWPVNWRCRCGVDCARLHAQLDVGGGDRRRRHFPRRRELVQPVHVSEGQRGDDRRGTTPPAGGRHVPPRRVCQRLQTRSRLICTALHVTTTCLLWSPCVIGQTIIFLPCDFYLLSFFFLSFFPRLISAATDWMSTILLHTVWP